MERKHPLSAVIHSPFIHNGKHQDVDVSGNRSRILNIFSTLYGSLSSFLKREAPSTRDVKSNHKLVAQQRTHASEWQSFGKVFLPPFR